MATRSYFDDEPTDLNSFWAETERRERQQPDDDDVSEDFEEPAIDIHDDLEVEQDEFEPTDWQEQFDAEEIEAEQALEAEEIEAGQSEPETVTLHVAPELRARTAREVILGSLTPEQLATGVMAAGFGQDIADEVANRLRQADDSFVVPETIEVTAYDAAEVERRTQILIDETAQREEIEARQDQPETPVAPAELPEGIEAEPPAEEQPDSAAEDEAAIARLERLIAGEVEQPTAEQTAFYNLTRDLQENTMILNLKVKGLTFRQRVKDNEDIYAEDVKDAAEDEMVTSTKKLLDCPELRAIKNCKKKFIKWLKFRKLDCSILKGGMFLIPHRNVTRVQVEYDLFRVARYNKVLELCRVYEQRVNENMAKLNKQKVLVKRSDYPSIKQIVAAFTVSKEWVPFSAPEALKAISETIWQEEMAGVQIKVASVAQDSLTKLQEAMQFYVNALVQDLSTPQANGKKRAISAERMADMRTFFAEIKNVNITNNAELDELAAKGARVIEGIEVAQLKGDEATRGTVLAAFQELQAVTSTWVVNVENNHMVVDEDDV